MKVNSHDLSKTLRHISSKWVALNPNTTRIVAVGNSPKSVIVKARNSGTDNPVLTRVPKDYGAYIL